ncbi:hypothetical protein Tco_1553437 [Tanacetum coccineum]
MAMISAFTTVDKTAHNSRKFTFTLSPTNYGYWRYLIDSFLITNNLIGFFMWDVHTVSSKPFPFTDGATVLRKPQLSKLGLQTMPPRSYANHLYQYQYASFRLVQGLREEYNGLKTTITARQGGPTAFSHDSCTP